MCIRDRNVDAQANEASATVANGTGSVVWADGKYYVGELKDCKMHGEGTYTFGTDQVLAGVTWPKGTTYVGEMFEDEFHGQGTKTLPDGTVQKGRFEHEKFMGK